MWTKLKLYFHTIKYLKPIQIWYRLFYVLRNKLGLYNLFAKQNFQLIPRTLKFSESISSFPWEVKDNTFEFLNQKVSFGKSRINWNYSEFGKLWTYNLNYFEFLTQSNLSKEEGLNYINDYIAQEKILLDGLEPYPISLRVIYWIRFLSKNKIRNNNIDKVLGKHLIILFNNIEYHVLGNHLLENGFALIFGGMYFSNKAMWIKGKAIVEKELEEQIKKDGAHFELSPMYHNIILYRLLDVYNLLIHNPVFNNQNRFTKKIQIVIERMLSWSGQINESIKRLPYFNDSVNGIVPSFIILDGYAEQLGINIKKDGFIPISISGYRIISENKHKLIIDGGSFGPTYITGHSHCDALSFEYYFDGNPIIVNSGISTYEKNNRRNSERSTSAHNTVKILDKEQSELWAGFRSARRSKSKILFSDEFSFDGICEYYTGELHRRSIELNSNLIIIKDQILGKKGNAYFHLSPEIRDEEVIENLFEFEGYNTFSIEDFYYALGFNKRVESKRIVVSFENELTTKINKNHLVNYF
jgi:hypothetical protein